MQRNSNVVFLAQFSILLAILAIFCFTPLGSIPIGPIVATLAMLPVIVTAILLGPVAGSVMGGLAGLFSLIVWTFMPPTPPAAFVFSPFYSLGEYQGSAASLLICLVPRVLVGTVAGLASRALSGMKNRPISYAIAGVLGSLTNTVLVLGGIWLFFGNQYATLFEAPMLAIIGILILTNGLPEAVVSAIVTPAVCAPLMKKRSL